jgi:SAM-dependent methyltransferase
VTPTTTAATRDDERIKDAYDSIPYRSRARTETHPEHLAMLAFLYGLQAAPADQCRVLELGCGDGGNLLPLALAYPNSHFVGVDLAPLQMEEGKQLANQLGITNLELQITSFFDLPNTIKPFDYIIVHGVFSWINPDAQHQLLEVCRDLLTPHGVLFISYNTFPGWHFDRGLRQMLLFATKQCTTLPEKVHQAKRLVHLLAKHANDSPTGHASLARQWEKRILQAPGDQYLAHEFLSENNHPVYFQDFVAMANKHGLRYLANADEGATTPENFGEHVAYAVESEGNERVTKQQIFDILRNCRFRETLLCHDQHDLFDHPQIQDLSSFHLLSWLKTTASESDILSLEEVDFVHHSLGTIRLGHPFTKAALWMLQTNYPSSLPIIDLIGNVHQRLSKLGLAPNTEEQMNEDVGTFFGLLCKAHVVEMVRLSQTPCPATHRIAAMPKTTALTRWELARQTTTTNLLHQTVTIDDPQLRKLATYLDGEHTLPQLCQAMGNDFAPPLLTQMLELIAQQALLTT